MSDDSSDDTISFLSTDSAATDSITWPPQGLTRQSILTLDEAVFIIAEGAVRFEAIAKPANHAMDRLTHFNLQLGMSNGMRILEATPPTALIAGCMSFSLSGDTEEPEPRSTLEQPSMTRCFGNFPGTVTLTRYMGSLNQPPTTIERPPKVMLRKIGLSQILDRLRALQSAREIPFGITEQDESFLYGQLVSDPETGDPERTLDQEINELSSLLNCDVWIDFSDQQKQLIVRYYTDQTLETPAELFFQQILLSAELDRRLRLFEMYQPNGSGRMVSVLPRKVAWSVVASRILLRSLTIKKLGVPLRSPVKSYLLVPKNKFPQLTRILDIGYALKWPSMDQVEARMQIEGEHETMQCQWSPTSETFLSGLNLPGPLASWTVLSCLLDCSPAHRSALVGVEEMYPQSGFQFLANTYWYWESIVGKVMGAMHGSKSVAGWIGPCMYTTDLGRVQYVRIYQKRTLERMKKRDRRTIAARSDPLGLPNTSYRVGDFELVLPDFEKTADNIRMEKLALKIHLDSSANEPGNLVEHDVAVRVLVDGISYPIRLRYDVSFIAAAACWAGPHVLFREYAYMAVGVNKLMYNFKWAGWDGATDSPTENPEDEDNDTVLLIEAYGVADNAVLARTW